MGINIIPTHNTLRDIDTLKFFIRRFKNGAGYMTRKKPCNICVVDGKYYLTDGHHESIAAYLTGFIDDTKYNIEKYTLDQMLEFNYPIWLTPFNPHTECRSANYWEFKTRILDSKMAVDEVLLNSHLYKEPRQVQSLAQLAMKVIDVDTYNLLKSE